MNRMIKILYLEDNPVDVELVKEILDSDKINSEISVVDNEKDYLQEIKKRRHDIILADFTFPHLTALKH